MIDRTSQLLRLCKSKQISLFVGLLCVLSLGAIGALAQQPMATVTVSAGSGTVKPGETIVIPIVANVSSGLMSVAGLDVQYDPSVLDAVSCKADPDGVFDAKFCNVNFDNNNANPDVVRFNVSSLAGVQGHVTLATITFQAVGAEGSSSSVGVVVREMAEPNGTAINSTPVNGSVQIEQQITSTPTPTPTKTTTSTPTATVTPTATSTPTATATTTVTATPTSTSVTLPTVTPTSSPTALPTSTAWNLYLPAVNRMAQSIIGQCTPSSAGESDNIADALTICDGQIIIGYVSEDDRWDVYKIAVEANRMLNAALVGNSGDADLYLFPPSANSLADPAAAWSRQDASNEAIDGTTLAGGDWYLAVYSYVASTDYQLKVTLGEMVTPPSCVPDAAGDSNNIPDAYAICPGQTVAGQVSPDDVWDLYKISLVQNTAIDVTMTGTGGDADLGVYVPSATDVLVDEPVALSNSTGNEERIAGVVSSSGSWYIAVKSYEGSTGYVLSVITPFVSTSTLGARTKDAGEQPLYTAPQDAQTQKCEYYLFSTFKEKCR